MTSEEIEKICKQMDSKLGPLDKVLATYEGAKGQWGNAKYFGTKKPNESWSFDDYEKWNAIYTLCHDLKRRQLIWDKNGTYELTVRLCGDYKFYNSNGYKVERATGGFDLFIRRNGMRYRFYCGDNNNQVKSKNEGKMGWVRICEELQKDNIDINNYVNDPEEGKAIKDSGAFPKYIIDRNVDIRKQTFDNCHHIDFHSSFPSGLVNTHPEFRPTIERLYHLRKTDPKRKLALNSFIGCRQSPHDPWHRRWTKLAKDAIEDNNRRIREMDTRLIANGDQILGHNTDGIWYQGPIYHGEGEGPELCQWRNDHINCRFRAKSNGAYEFIEDGQYTPVIRGHTNLDRIKPDRSTWSWGDIFHLKQTVYTFKEDEGIVPVNEDPELYDICLKQGED